MNVRALKFLLVFRVLNFESANLFENSAINIKYIKTPLSGKTVKSTQTNLHSSNSMFFSMLEHSLILLYFLTLYVIIYYLF